MTSATLGPDCLNRQVDTHGKQTVENQHRSAATVANTLAKLLDDARCTWTTLEYRPSSQTAADSLKTSNQGGSAAQRRGGGEQ
jgi:hypothetical protein